MACFEGNLIKNVDSSSHECGLVLVRSSTLLNEKHDEKKQASGVEIKIQFSSILHIFIQGWVFLNHNIFNIYSFGRIPVLRFIEHLLFLLQLLFLVNYATTSTP